MAALSRDEAVSMSEAPGQDPLAALRHDLANLLMTVRGYAELLLVREGLDPGLRRYPEQILTAVDRASAMLDAMRQARETGGFITSRRSGSGLPWRAAK